MPSVRRRQLAAQLRRLREVATLTGDEVATRVGWSPSKVSRIETCQSEITLTDLRKLLDLYEVAGSQRDRLLELGRNAQQRGWWDAYSDTLRPEVATLIALEADAESVRWYAPAVTPGLLQTEEYARHVISSSMLMAPPTRIERLVQVRLTSQDVLSRKTPLDVAVVLDEAVLRRPVGGPEVLAGQLRHLLELAEQPNISIQVLPFTAGAHPALTGGYAILRFSEFLAADVVYLENMTSDLFVESEVDVYRYGLAFNQLCALALGEDDSKALIAEAADSATRS